MRMATLALVAGVGVASVARVARAQEEFPEMLQGGSGLIDIPVAYVPPLTGDFGLTLSSTLYHTSPAIPEYTRQFVPQGAFSVALLGRLQLGVSAYSTDPTQGFFWQALLLDQDDFHSGIWRVLPSIAVGMRNIGPYQHIDRFGLGYGLDAVPGATAPRLEVDSLHQSLKTGNTLYGVATKSITVGSGAPGWSTVGFSFSIGYGNGLFSNHGSIPVAEYGSAHTGGLFGGVNANIHPSVNTLITLMAENDGWDDNVGAAVSYRGIRAEVALTELGAGSYRPVAAVPTTALYNYTKVNVSLGWQGNLGGVLQGNLLADRAARLEAEHKRLLAEVGRRSARIAQLQAEIANDESQNRGDLDTRRAQIEDEIRAEEAELQQLNDEIQRIERQGGGGAHP